MEEKHAELLVEICIELPFMLFSIAILYCVVQKFRSGTAPFASDFFFLYIVQAATDLSDYYVNLVIYRLARFGLLPFLCLFPWVNILHNTHCFLAEFQRILHALIAYNRFAALSSASLVPEPGVRKRSRNRRAVALCSFAALLTTIPGFLCRMEFIPSPTPPVMRMSINVPWAGMAFNGLASIVAVLTMATCAYCDVKAILAYKALSKQRRTKMRDELWLLAFALLQSFTHFWITASMVTLMVSSATKNFALSALVQNYYTLISDVYTFSTPVFLFITSSHVRKSLMGYVKRSSSIVPNDSANRANGRHTATGVGT